jgi:hypothetical protein
MNKVIRHFYLNIVIVVLTKVQSSNVLNAKQSRLKMAGTQQLQSFLLTG